MKPTWQTDDGSVRLFHGDCLDVLPTLEAGSIDAVVTDPPYGMNNDVDSSRFTGGSEPLRRGQGGGRFKTAIIGDCIPFDPSRWLCFPKVILWGANHYAQRLPAGTTLVWLKRYDKAFGTFLSDAEIAWSKGGCGVYVFRDLSMKSNERGRLHPNQKPLPLMVWCINRASIPGATILDPYMGSGTTGVACVRTGRKFIGVEIDEKYFDIAVKRIQAELSRFPLFEKAKT